MEPTSESILARLDLPEGFGYALLMLALALLLAPYLKGSDFGLVKIPDFEPPVRKTLRVVGPLLMAAAILAHVPILTAGDATGAGQEARAVEQTSGAGSFDVSQGKQVLAPRGDGQCLYPATVLSLEGEVVRVRFAFGRDGQAPADRVMSVPGSRPGAVTVADQVLVRLSPQAIWAPGEIKEIRQGRAMVALDPEADCAGLYERPYAWAVLAGQDWRPVEGGK